MSLTTTLNIAQGALSANAALSTIVSRNIAGVNDPNFATKTAQLATVADGGVRVAGVANASDAALFANLLSAKAGAASASAVSDGLGQLEATLGLSTTTAADGSASDTSPATLLGNLTDALQQYAASPSTAALGAAAVTAGKALASNLNAAAKAVQDVREGADRGIAAAVASVNGLLAQFGAANAAVVKATLSGADATDALDKRNSVLQSLSSEIGISTADAGNGGLALYTDGGATLFQGTARAVSFTPTGAFAPGTAGGAVTVDGVPVTGAGATMASRGGAIAGLAALRDTVAPAYGDQLDQIAAGLISAFAGNTASDGSGAAVAGLFMAGSSTAVPAPPAAAGSAAGLAAALTVSAAAAADPTRLRDGGLNGAASGNPGGAAGYAAGLNSLLATLDKGATFDGTSGGAASGTLADYAASSVSWLEAERRSASTTSTDRAAVVTQTTTSLSSATGVNLDDQLGKMLDLEHSYQASAELMSTVKSMLDSLLQAVN